MKNFIELCISGDALADEIDNYIDSNVKGPISYRKNLLAAEEVLKGDMGDILLNVLKECDCVIVDGDIVKKRTNEIVGSISYKDAGVSIDVGNEIVANIKENVMSTWTNKVISDYGDFAGVYSFNRSDLIVASTDGVGTKTLLTTRVYGSAGYEMLGT